MSATVRASRRARRKGWRRRRRQGGVNPGRGPSASRFSLQVREQRQPCARLAASGREGEPQPPSLKCCRLCIRLLLNSAVGELLALWRKELRAGPWGGRPPERIEEAAEPLVADALLLPFTVSVEVDPEV